MGLPELGLDLLPLRYHLFHFLFMAQVKVDCAIDLLQTQSWVVRSDRFRLFAVAVLPNDSVNRHTAPHQVKATFAVLDEDTSGAPVTKNADEQAPPSTDGTDSKPKDGDTP